jgi:hypothetical protein
MLGVRTSPSVCDAGGVPDGSRCVGEADHRIADAHDSRHPGRGARLRVRPRRGRGVTRGRGAGGRADARHTGYLLRRLRRLLARSRAAQCPDSMRRTSFHRATRTWRGCGRGRPHSIILCALRRGGRELRTAVCLSLAAVMLDSRSAHEARPLARPRPRDLVTSRPRDLVTS